MRKILFRGRDGTGKWHEGNLIVVNVKKPVQKDVAPYKEYYIKGQAFGSVEKEVDPETIGSLAFEATDVHPEIWEGDIIEDKDGYRMKVMHDPYRRTFNVITNSISGLGYEALDDGYLHFKFKNRGAKVVGNIHDNPELFREPLTFCEYAPKGQTN